MDINTSTDDSDSPMDNEFIFQALVTENFRLQCQVTPLCPKKGQAGLAFFRTQMGGKNEKKNSEDSKAVVGDIVDCRQLQNGDLVVERIYPRRNSIHRQEAGNRFLRKQIVAANLDGIILCQSLDNPAPRWGFLDRILVLAENEGIEPIILITKCDLLIDSLRQPDNNPLNPTQSNQESLVSKRMAQWENFLSIYLNLPYQSIFLAFQDINSASLSSDLTDQCRLVEKFFKNLPSLHPVPFFCGQEEAISGVNSYLKKKRWAVIGNSGVGKSTLIRNLSGKQNIRINEINAKIQKGRHTTTHASMYRIPDGPDLIDTAGLREFGLSTIEPEKIGHFYPEFRPYLTHCKLNNCRHEEEPECAVQEAVMEGHISSLRYRNYRMLLASLNEIPFWKKGGKGRKERKK